MEEIETFMKKDCRDDVIELITNQFLIREGKNIKIPSQKNVIELILQQEYRYISARVNTDSDQNYLAEIKNYLATVQRQLSHVEAESRKSFLNLRTMVDKIADQGKEHLNITLEKAIDKNSETGAWVTIPHVSPIGLYEPIQTLRNNFKEIIEELERSLSNLVQEYHEYSIEILENNIEDKKVLDTIEGALGLKQSDLEKETQHFNEEVLISLNEQLNLLEKNLGSDLMEQFDAIERLNDLKPERIWIMLEETRSEMNVYLNNVYSRILREINSLQLKVDISKVSLILTNEAGKAMKKVDKIQQEAIKNLKPIKELIDELD